MNFGIICTFSSSAPLLRPVCCFAECALIELLMFHANWACAEHSFELFDGHHSVRGHPTNIVVDIVRNFTFILFIVRACVCIAPTLCRTLGALVSGWLWAKLRANQRGNQNILFRHRNSFKHNRNGKRWRVATQQQQQQQQNQFQSRLCTHTTHIPAQNIRQFIGWQTQFSLTPKRTDYSVLGSGLPTGCPRCCHTTLFWFSFLLGSCYGCSFALFHQITILNSVSFLFFFVKKRQSIERKEQIPAAMVIFKS